MTHGLEGRCSIQLSYRGASFKRTSRVTVECVASGSPLNFPYRYRITTAKTKFYATRLACCLLNLRRLVNSLIVSPDAALFN